MIRYGLYDGVMSSLDETNFKDRFNSFGSMIGNTIAGGMKKNLIDDNYASQILEIENQVADYLAGGTAFNMNAIYEMAQEVQSLTAKTELDTLKIQNAMSAFEIGDINYVNASQGIEYSTGVSSSTQYVFNSTSSTNIGNLVSNTDKASLMKWTNLIAPSVVEVIERNLGKKFN